MVESIDGLFSMLLRLRLDRMYTNQIMQHNSLEIDFLCLGWRTVNILCFNHWNDIAQH